MGVDPYLKRGSTEMWDVSKVLGYKERNKGKAYDWREDAVVHSQIK